MKILSRMLTQILSCLLLVAATAIADETSFKEYGDTRVHYSAFNSSFVPPDIASIYNISRGKDKGLVNIAIVPKGSESGETASVSGAVNDLLQRQQKLEFIEVREGDAVYYLAEFEFENEDPLTFKITVRPADSTSTQNFSFQRTFYHDE